MRKRIRDFWENNSPYFYIGFCVIALLLTWAFHSSDEKERERREIEAELRDELQEEYYDEYYNEGYQDGYSAAYDESEALTLSLEDAYSSGYDEGYSAGYEEGESIGLDNGYEDGYAEGYSDGCGDEYDTAYEEGYTSGHADGLYDGYTMWGCTEIVYITSGGEKYHRSGCQYLDEDASAITVADAVFIGREPCSVCDPPTE